MFVLLQRVEYRFRNYVFESFLRSVVGGVGIVHLLIYYRLIYIVNYTFV